MSFTGIPGTGKTKPCGDEIASISQSSLSCARGGGVG